MHNDEQIYVRPFRGVVKKFIRSYWELVLPVPRIPYCFLVLKNNFQVSFYNKIHNICERRGLESEILVTWCVDVMILR